MTSVHHNKRIIFREHDIKKTTLKKVKHKMLSFYDISEQDLYKHPSATERIEFCKEYGYPILIQVEDKIRLLIFDRPIC